MTEKITRQGPLVAIGGAEDKTAEAVILQQVLEMSDADAPVVGVITTASSVPDDVFPGYADVFARLGASETLDVRIRTRAHADEQKFVDMIDRCDVVFISGGDQMRLTNTMGGCRTLDAIRRRREAGAVVAGTSAGAACQSATMVYGGPSDDSLRKGAVKMSAGFGLVQDNVIIDTHFLERGRFSRLMEVGATNPEYIGIGLGEDAAVLFSDGIVHSFGPGHVVIVDSSQITGSNVYDLHDGEAVSVSNVIMHALVDGYGYSLSDRRVLTPQELGASKTERNVAHN